MRFCGWVRFRPQQLTQVLTEFYGLLETQQYMVRGGEESALEAVDRGLWMQQAQQVLNAGKKVRDRTGGDLEMLQGMEAQQLSKFLEDEHPQAVALVLAHLDVKRGTAVLMHLPEAQRVDVVKRLAEMRQFSPEMAAEGGSGVA